MNINNISPLKFNFFLNKTEKDKSPVLKNCYAQNPIAYNNAYPKNYYINNLVFKGKDFSEQLIEKLTSSSQDELFEFLDRELKKRIRAKGYHFQTTEDAVQNAMIEIFMIMSEYDLPADASEVAGRINEVYDKIKPDKRDYISDYGVRSLQEHNETTDKELIDSITEDQILPYLSAVSEEEREKQRKTIEKLMKKADLTEKQKELLRGRYVGDFSTYQQVADENDSSKIQTRLKIKGAILEIQAKKGIVPADIKQKITDLAKVLDISYEEAQSLSIRYIDILNIPIETVKERISKILDAFKDEKLTKERYVKAIKASPTLISQEPATVEANVRNLVEKFSDVGLTVGEYLNACLRAPTLFGQSPATIESNITDLVRKYKDKGLTVQEYLKACLNSPPLFHRSPDTIAEHIDIIRYCDFNTGKNISDEEFFQNISKKSAILLFSSETLLIERLILRKMFENSSNRGYSEIREFFASELENGIEDDEIQTPEDIKAYLIAKLDSYLQDKADSETNFISKDIKKEAKLRQRFEDYLRNNKNKTYAIKVKNIDCDTDCTGILRSYLNDLSIQITGSEGMFNVICEDDDSCTTYIETSRKHGLSSKRLFHSLQGAKLEIRINKGELTDEEQKKIDDLSLLLGISNEQTQQLVIDNPAIMNIPIETIEYRINSVVKKFENEGLTMQAYLKACARKPQLFYQSPDTIEKNVRDLVKKFEKEGLKLKPYVQACARQPQLFYQSPETIEKNVRDLVKKFEKEGLTTQQYLKDCLEKPQLFCQSPDTIEKNVRDLVKKFEKEGLKLKPYIQACARQPQLFYQSPETIEKNVRGLVKKFENEGLTMQAYLQSCVKQPSLFIQSPNNIKKNVVDLVKKFKKEGLTTQQYLKDCLEQPSLFTNSPETIEKNVRGLVKKFENEGLNMQAYLQACVKRPQLFSLLPATIERNVRGLVKKFENDGLTMQAYLQSCVKQPPLFSQFPDTVESNVRDLVKKFENKGLTTKAYLETCLKQPTLFCMSPETIAQHIDILRFAKYNCGEEIDNKEFFEKILKRYVDLTYSSKLLLIKYLIIPKMFGGSKVPKELKGESGFEKKLINYLKNNPDEKYTINVKNIKAESDLEDILKRTLCTISHTALNRDDVFSINFTN